MKGRDLLTRGLQNEGGVAEGLGLMFFESGRLKHSASLGLTCCGEELKTDLKVVLFQSFN